MSEHSLLSMSTQELATLNEVNEGDGQIGAQFSRTPPGEVRDYYDVPHNHIHPRALWVEINNP